MGVDGDRGIVVNFGRGGFRVTSRAGVRRILLGFRV